MKRKELKAKLISVIGEYDGLEVYKKMKNQFDPSGCAQKTWKDYVFSKSSVNRTIYGFCVWNETTEGHNYWSDLAGKFND